MRKKFIGKKSKSFARVLSLILAAAMVMSDGSFATLAADTDNSDEYVAEYEQQEESVEEASEIALEEIEAETEVESEDIAEEADAEETQMDEADEALDIEIAEIVEDVSEEISEVSETDAEEVAIEIVEDDTDSEETVEAEEETEEAVEEEVDTELEEENIVEADGAVVMDADGNITGYTGTPKDGVVTIPADAINIKPGVFAGNTSIKSVDFSKATKLKNIEYKAFLNCVNLSTVDLSACESLTYIGVEAFKGVGSLVDAETKIVLPPNLNYIDETAFGECTNLKSIVFNKELIQVSRGAFSSCKNLSNVEINKKLSTAEMGIFTGCNLKKIDFEEGITLIPNNLFASATFAAKDGDADFVAEVTIPATVTTIGSMAFSGAKNFDKITFTKTGTELSTIGASAFSGCDSLSAVNLTADGWKLRSIGDQAFMNCKGLTSFEMPDSLVEAGVSAFAGCTGLKTVHLSTNEEYTAISDNLFNMGANQLMTYGLTSIEFPANIKTIGKNAFADNKFTALPAGKLVIPDTITFVDEGAFQCCQDILDVYISKSLTEISASTFFACDSLCAATDLYIPYNVKTIGANAFNGLINVKKVVIELKDASGATTDGNLTEIGTKAFGNDILLTDFVLPLSLTTIGDEAFSGDDDKKMGCGFTNVVIPKNVTSIGKEAYQYVKLTSVTFECENLKKCGEGIFNLSTLENVTFPDKMTEIPDNLFYKATFKTGTELEIPSAITRIGKNAFAGTKDEVCNLVSIKFSTAGKSDVTEIGNGAFAYCTALDGFVITDKVTSIGNEAFLYDTALTEIKIPRNVTTLGERAFKDCTKLRSVTFEGGIKEGKLLTGNELHTIKKNAFEGCKALTEVDLSQGLLILGDEVFKGCSKLNHVFMPSTIDTLGKNIFADCNDAGLEFLTGSDTRAYEYLAAAGLTTKIVTEKTAPTRVNVIEYSNSGHSEMTNSKKNSTCYEVSPTHSDGADIYFYDPEEQGSEFVGWYTDAACTAGNEITSTAGKSGKITIYPKFKSIEAIGGMFTWKVVEGNSVISGLTDEYKNTDFIIIPVSANIIAKNAFAGKTNISRVIFETKTNETPKLQIIESGAFSGCTKLRTIDLRVCNNLDKIDERAFSGCSLVNKIYFPQDENHKFSVSKQAFMNCTSLEDIVIPANMDEIGDEAFSGCKKLANITLNSDTIVYRATTAENYKFDIDIWDFIPVQTVYKFSGLFKGCAISNVTYGEGVTTIPSGFFCNATFAEDSYTIPAQITAIGTGAFRGCTTLKTIDFSQATKLKAIYAYAFEGMKNLETVDLSKNTSLLTILGFAFSGCANMDKIILPNSIALFDQHVFDGCAAMTVCDISKTEISAIPDAAFANCGSLASMKLPERVESIGVSAFSGCVSLETIELNDKVASIGKYAFSKCMKLKSFTAPAVLESIGTEAFNGCLELADVKLSEGVVDIEAATFQNCKALKTITLSTSVNSIGGYAFNGCSALEKINLGNCITEIGMYAFKDCESLTTVEFPATLQKIGAEAFMNCLIGRVELPRDLISIGKNAFRGNKYLSTVSVNSIGLKTGAEAIFMDCWIETINFSKEATMIPEGLFQNAGYKSNVDLVIPASIVSIGKNAFCGNDQYISKINSVTFEEGSKLEKIGANAFQYTSIDFLDMPDSVTEFGEYSFANCDRLKEAWISANVTKVPRFAFAQDKSLEKIVFKGNKITDIMESAFFGAGELTAIDIPVGVRTIGKNAFNGCSKLDYVYIPSSVKTIDKTAFGGTTGDLNPNFLISAEEGSAAYQFAVANKIPVTTDGLHSISYVLNGATRNSDMNATSYRENGEDVIFYPVEKMGYDFVGWCLDEGCLTTPVTKLSDITDAQFKNTSLILYAKFELQWDKVAYTISFISKAPAGFSIPNPPNIKVVSENEATLYDEKTVSADGLTLVGWNTKTDYTGVTYKPGEVVKKLATKNNDTVTLYAMWEYDTYNITYELGGGTNAATNKTTYTSVDVKTANIKLDPPTAPAGTKFVCWYDDAWNKVTEIPRGSKGDITLFAYYEAATYFTLKLNKNGSEAVIGNNATNPTKGNVLSDAAVGIKLPVSCEITLPSDAAISRPGYIFEGWCTKSKVNPTKAPLIPKGSKVSAMSLGVTKPGKKVTLYAIWTPIVYKFDVSVDVKNGEYFTAKDAAKIAVQEKTHTVVKTVKLYTPKRDGYIFAGWDNTTTKEVEAYKGKLPKNVACDAILVPTWTPIKYKVNFNANGGLIGISKSLLLKDCAYDSVIANAPATTDVTNMGRTFVGWNTKKDGTGTFYAAGTELKNLTIKKGATVKLYAIWQ